MTAPKGFKPLPPSDKFNGLIGKIEDSGDVRDFVDNIMMMPKLQATLSDAKRGHEQNAVALEALRTDLSALVNRDDRAQAIQDSQIRITESLKTTNQQMASLVSAMSQLIDANTERNEVILKSMEAMNKNNKEMIKAIDRMSTKVAEQVSKKDFSFDMEIERDPMNLAKRVRVT